MTDTGQNNDEIPVSYSTTASFLEKLVRDRPITAAIAAIIIGIFLSRRIFRQ